MINRNTKGIIILNRWKSPLWKYLTYSVDVFISIQTTDADVSSISNKTSWQEHGIHISFISRLSGNQLTSSHNLLVGENIFKLSEIFTPACHVFIFHTYLFSINKYSFFTNFESLRIEKELESEKQKGNDRLCTIKVPT